MGISWGPWKPLGSSYSQKLWRNKRKIAGAKSLYTLQLGMLLLLHSDICTGKEENGRSWKKRGCFTYTGVCLGWSYLWGNLLNSSARLNVGTLLPMLCLLSPAPSWTVLISAQTPALPSLKRTNSWKEELKSTFSSMPPQLQGFWLQL